MYTCIILTLYFSCDAKQSLWCGVLYLHVIVTLEIQTDLKKTRKFKWFFKIFYIHSAGKTENPRGYSSSLCISNCTTYSVIETVQVQRSLLEQAPINICFLGTQQYLGIPLESDSEWGEGVIVANGFSAFVAEVDINALITVPA